MKIHGLLTSLLLISGSVFAQEFPQQRTLTHFVMAGTISEQKAIESIVASNVVNQGATALYTAGKSVSLQPGFVAQAGSVFTATIAPVISSRSASSEPDLSVRAYPNPFTEHTTIEYTLPLSGQVRHTLLNANGQLVQQVEAAPEQSAGTHQIQLDGGNLPVGVYLYQVQLGPQNRILRLIKK